MFSFGVYHDGNALTLQTPGCIRSTRPLKARLQSSPYDPSLTYVDDTFYVRDYQGYRTQLNTHQAMMYNFWSDLLFVKLKREMQRSGKFQYIRPTDSVYVGDWHIASNNILYKSEPVTPIDKFTLHIDSSPTARTTYGKWHLHIFVALSMALNAAHLEY